jgi:hypothetical protein
MESACPRSSRCAADAPASPGRRYSRIGREDMSGTDQIVSAPACTELYGVSFSDHATHGMHEQVMYKRLEVAAHGEYNSEEMETGTREGESYGPTV